MWTLPYNCSPSACLCTVLAVQVSQLHPPAPEFAQDDVAADVALSSEMNLLRRGKQTGAAAADPEAEQQQQRQLGELPMALCWTSVIWTLALQHKNLQVGWSAWLFW